MFFYFRNPWHYYDSRYNPGYICKADKKLLKYIKCKCSFDWKILLNNFRYEQYVWRFYPNLKENPKFESFSDQLELAHKTNGLPKNIIFIVGLVNILTCFNRRIKLYLYILHWNRRIFIYYNRYYRYLANEKKFGKRNFIKSKYRHKLHFIAYIHHREFTGVRNLDKNHLCY